MHRRHDLPDEEWAIFGAGAAGPYSVAWCAVDRDHRQAAVAHDP